MDKNRDIEKLEQYIAEMKRKLILCSIENNALNVDYKKNDRDLFKEFEAIRTIH